MKEKKIISSWQANAENWIQLIESGSLESRKLVTNQAIIDAVMQHRPGTVLDIGCGEGWLSLALHQRGVEVWGFDAIASLTDEANKKIPGRFQAGSYEEFAAGKLSFPHLFDAIVINFALIGKESTEQLLRAVPRFLTPSGRLIIQTLHPFYRKDLDDYVSGWKEGSWDGLGPAFVQPYSWYFRTLEDWLQLLMDCGFTELNALDTRHPVSGNLLSLILDCKTGI